MKSCTIDHHVKPSYKCGNFTLCGNLVCNNCNTEIDRVNYCNLCADEIHNDAYATYGVCPNDGTECAPIYENNGYAEGEGPTHYEIVGYKPCPECGYKEEL